MASLANNSIPSVSSSSTRGVVTPSASTDTPSHASTACSNSTTASDQPYQPSYPLQTYLEQSPYEDASLHGRFAGQPATAEVWGRVAFHMARAQREIDRFDERFGARR